MTTTLSGVGMCWAFLSVTASVLCCSGYYLPFWIQVSHVKVLGNDPDCRLYGKGLGKDETGISKPIKSDLKFNKMGIGYQEKLSEETKNRWWEKMYNQAASNISSSGSSNEKKGFDASAFAELTDEELFKACGGRTAHKAARHGLQLNGKLERIQHQEKLNGSDPGESTQSKKSKKISQCVDKRDGDKKTNVSEPSYEVIEESFKEVKIKKRKKDKCAEIPEAVAVTENSSECGSKKKKKSDR